MNIAIIDIGSNTIRMNLYQVEDQDYRVLMTKKYTAGIAAYVENQRLSPKGIKILGDILQRLQALLANVKVDQVYAFATAALRNADNGQEVVDIVGRISGLEIQILSREDEARLGNLAIRHNHFYTEGLTVDIGGGSTEIVHFKGDQIESFFISQGSLSLYLDQIDGIFPKRKEEKKLRKQIQGLIPELPVSDVLLAIGGTARSAGKIIAELNVQREDEYSIKQLNEVTDKLLNHDDQAVKSLLRVSPERVHTIIPGLLLLHEVAKKSEAKRVVVFTEGIREGFLLDLISRQTSSL